MMLLGQGTDDSIFVIFQITESTSYLKTTLIGSSYINDRNDYCIHRQFMILSSRKTV